MAPCQHSSSIIVLQQPHGRAGSSDFLPFFQPLLCTAHCISELQVPSAGLPVTAPYQSSHILCSEDPPFTASKSTKATRNVTRCCPNCLACPPRPRYMSMMKHSNDGKDILHQTAVRIAWWDIYISQGRRGASLSHIWHLSHDIA